MQSFIDLNHIYSLQEGNPHKGNLYLGSYSVLNNMQGLKSRKIDCVLTLLDDRFYTQYRVKQKLVSGNITTFQRINIQDEEAASILPHFSNAHVFIKMNLQTTNVLVHCFAGVSRSSSVVMAFLMKQNGLKRDQAMNFVKQKRKIVSPNQTFWEELKQWQNSLIASHKK